MAALQPREPDKLGAFQRAYSHRALLPFEVDLCNTLDLTKEEYFYFCELADSKAKERAAEYAHIPDVRNDPVSVIVSLVIGIALSAVAAAIAPKPKQPKEKEDPRQLRTADNKGQSKYAEYFSFDSFQDLAALGTVLPLVFANKNNDKNIGGIRVKALLVWSQMLSLSTQQELKAMFTFGMGPLARPALKGYALGDQLLSGYTPNKFALYFRNDGGRIHESSDRYGETTMDAQSHDDVFLGPDDWQPNGLSPLFCGSRTPTSQTTFGVSAPIPN